MNSCASSCSIWSRSASPYARQPVDDPVVDHLRLRARAGVRSCRPRIASAVAVCTSSPRRKISFSTVLVGDVGEQPQLHLRVVGRDQPVARPRPRSRRGSRGPARCGSGCSGGSGWCSTGARWSVAVWLKVVCRRPSSPISSGKRVEVGRLQLRELAPLLDRRDDLVLVADRLEHARVGGEAGLAAALARQPELLEQDRRRAAAASRS